MAILRAIPDTMDAAAVAAIDARLTAVRDDHGVTVPLAIESGSRAWGFPSPDSDYDCRFVFVRPIEHYLTPWPRRDVIETPLIDELDVNGWDLGKALKLLLKGNAVIIEWLTSPILYRVDDDFRSGLLTLAAEVADRRLIGRHYLYLGQLQRKKHFADDGQASLKKLFYVLRPAAALRWLRLNPGAAVAPMNFLTLMQECDPPPTLSAVVDDLLAKKARTRELGSARIPDEIANFADGEFQIAEEEFAIKRRVIQDAWRRERAEAFFRKAIDLVWNDREKPIASAVAGLT